MNKFFSIFALFFIVSCTIPTNEGYENMLNSWLGKSENELIASWGIPDGSYEKKIEGVNVKYLTYNATRNVYIPDANNMGTALSGSFVSRSCKTIFAVDKDDSVIFSWKYEGNDCQI